MKLDYGKVSAELARTLYSKTLVPFLRRGMAYSSVGLMAFLAIAMIVYQLEIPSQNVSEVMRGFETFLLFGSFVVVGMLTGLGCAFYSVAAQKVGDLGAQLNGYMEGFLSELFSRSPYGQRAVELSAFRGGLDRAIEDLPALGGAEGRRSVFSGLVTRHLRRQLVRKFRTGLLEDFLRTLEGRGETQVSLPVVERYVRDKLVSGFITDVRLKLRVSLWCFQGLMLLLLLPSLLGPLLLR